MSTIMNELITNKIYYVKKIGHEVSSSQSCNETVMDIFKFKKKFYTKLFNFCKDKLISALKLNYDFYLTNQNEDLWLCFTPGVHWYKYCEKRKFLISMFTASTGIESSSSSNACTSEMNLINELYELLRESHIKKDILQHIPNNVQHNVLIPKLKAYQSRTVQWLMHREQCNDYLNHNYSIVVCPNIPDVKFYLNYYTGHLTDEEPKNIAIPSGGILADEMGLGKTVEIIDLILLNPRIIQNKYCDIMDEEPLVKKFKYGIFCICSDRNRKTKMINCIKCGVAQHVKCVSKFKAKNSKIHICPECWKNEKIITSRATVIVTPYPIRRQWFLEMKKHTSNALKVFVYEGIGKAWISPAELYDYDVILTDYNVIKAEINFSGDNESNLSLRTKKKYMRLTSPLLMISWWRVCLDEAQMVESINCKAALMVQKLPTVHRWAVTGTPIDKSIDDLRGIIEYLKLHPVHHIAFWRPLLVEFRCNNKTPLITILNKIMWRNCKKYVLEELDIPMQHQKVHFVDMSDVEKLFYESQIRLCSFNFNENLNKLIMYQPINFKLNPKLFKLILEPVKKLRQDCTVPVLSQVLQPNVIKKQLLKPKELLDHLRSTNEIECKTQLRTIASSYNGKAGIYMIREKFSEAVKMYKNVLNLARMYTDSISVDSLLQIHAIHNLLIALQKNESFEMIEKIELDSMLISLEKKYLEPYYKNLNLALNAFEESKKDFAESRKQISWPYLEKCWLTILEILNSQNISDELIFKINTEHGNVMDKSRERFKNLKGLEYFLTCWFQKIIESQKNVFKKFEVLWVFVETITKISDGDKTADINNFIKSVFNCHLNQLRINTTDDIERPNECCLCKAKIELDEQECLIFDKKLMKITNTIGGNWNPSSEENILRLILNFSATKTLPDEIINECKETLLIIHNMKKLYKDLRKLWIEIEYVVKAHDELDMCKERLQIIEKNAVAKSINQIYSFELLSNETELDMQLRTAEIDFVRKKGRLNYIKHLYNSADPGPCPICKQNITSKYTVLHCGHHMCLMCLVGMSHFQKTNITCAICRNKQKLNDIYYVTIKTMSSEEVDIKGQYSSKIEKILTIIINLKSNDPNVKILIFSHWETVLREIGQALENNTIEYRCKWNQESIDEFKDIEKGITCLLLLLSHGSKGLNLIEATHIIIVEPILNPGEEMQAISRIHRIGQTKETTIHKFIVRNTIEENIFNAISETNKWNFENISIADLRKLFCDIGSYA